MKPPQKPEASDVLFEDVYSELRSIARQRLAAERPDHTLQATALVHETYLRLMKRPGSGALDKGAFYAAAAQAMRRILIEHARRRGRAKRGGNWQRVPLDGLNLAEHADSGRIAALDDAIQRLEKLDPRAAEVVRLRYYVGLSLDETAQALDVARRTVARDWEYSRAWLFKVLEESEEQES
jgi:RNA polymerase sigma factor (TIGR02999 family)